ncbi:Uncharacterised protein [Klebsiella pneumoniae]|nr:Uncharacterised protein [Klebsiella pneumoniae]
MTGLQLHKMRGFFAATSCRRNSNERRNMTNDEKKGRPTGLFLNILNQAVSAFSLSKGTLAYASSLSSLRFHPPCSSSAVYSTPARSEGISISPFMSTSTFPRPSFPAKYPSSYRTFWRARSRVLSDARAVPLSSGVISTMAKLTSPDSASNFSITVLEPSGRSERIISSSPMREMKRATD